MKHAIIIDQEELVNYVYGAMVKDGTLKPDTQYSWQFLIPRDGSHFTLTISVREEQKQK